MTDWKDKLTSPLARNAAIALYVLCVAGLIMVYMSVSLRQVDYTAYMRAQPEVVPGLPVAMRGLVDDARLGKPLRSGEVRFSLVEAGSINASQGVEWARTQIQPSGYFHLRAPLPDAIEPGDYRLVMRAQTGLAGAGADEDFVTGAPFRVLAPSPHADDWPESTERRIADANEASGGIQSSKGPIEVAIWPSDGQVARGLDSRVYIRTTRREDGAPVSTKLYLTQIDGMSDAKIPATLQTDALGLVSVPVRAATDLVWRLSTEAPMRLGADDRGDDKDDEEEQDHKMPENSHARLVLSTVPSQVSLRMTDPLAVAGKTADGAVQSLFQEGGLMVDLYQADHWVDAKVFGISEKGGGIRVEIPNDISGLPDGEEGAARPVLLYRVQVYRSIYGVENAWDIDYLVGAPDDQLADYQQAARSLADYLSGHVDDPYFEQILSANAFELSGSKSELRTWISAMSEALPRHLNVPPPLINSRAASIEKLEAEVAEIQKKLKLLTAIALLIGLAFVGYLVLLGVGSHREQGRLLQDVDLEMAPGATQDLGEEAELSRNIQRENIVFGVLIFIVVGTLALFALGVLTLLSYF